MRKFVLVLILALYVFFFINVSPSKAAIVTVDKDGEVIWNVLSVQDEMFPKQEVEDFSVRKIAEINSVGNDVINVVQDNGKVSLSVGTGENAKNINVENIQDTLIEIEERPATQKLTIGKDEDKFTINQHGTVVNTTLPIQVNPKTARLSFGTSTGNTYLYILPEEALTSVYRSKIANRMREGEKIELVEDQAKLVYKIPGKKLISVLGLYDYSFEVDTYVSAQTGELVNVEAPTWYKIFGFLITQEL